MMKLPVPSERLTSVVAWAFAVFMVALVAWVVWQIVT